ncbi:MAG: hypothetical protein ACXAC5_03805 [Promethearchaeota archaeon]|jgi:hypothetical protein
MDNLKVKVTLYKDHLCIETLRPKEKVESFIPAGDGRIGCVLHGTKGRLGISKEALEWLKKVPTSHDDIGDVDAWETDKGKYCFGWLGGVYSIKSQGVTGSRTYSAESIPHVEIPNDVPEGAKQYVDGDDHEDD